MPTISMRYKTVFSISHIIQYILSIMYVLLSIRKKRISKKRRRKKRISKKKNLVRVNVLKPTDQTGATKGDSYIR